jgi:hypothetical protein
MDRRPPFVLLSAAHDTTSLCSCHFYLNAFYHNDRIHEGLGDQTPAAILGKEIKSPKGM